MTERAFGGTERTEMLFVLETEDSLSAQVLAAKNDEKKLEALIRRSRRFILGCASRTTHRFITESDDEWSIALIAFHEAVKTYEPDKGAFKQFAALVIRRRLLDELGRVSRRSAEIAADLSGGGDEDDESVSSVRLEAEKKMSEEAVRQQEEQTSVRDEIEAAGQLLGRYGISFFDLAECSPKAQKTKDACAAVVRALLADRALFEKMRSTGALPAARLCEITGVSKKIPENHRKYIIAAAEILNGDLPQLAEYLRYIRKGGEAE